MKKLLVVITILTFLLATMGMVFAAGAGNTDVSSSGPAPNSGDGIPDGSGLDAPSGPNGDGVIESGTGPSGPAPNSGDGIPDGSGLDTPNSPGDCIPNGTGDCIPDGPGDCVPNISGDCVPNG